VTVKLDPELVSVEVVSNVALRVPMLIAWYCHAESLIGPVTPLIVADAFVNVTVPKLAIDETLLPTVGASTIHSALVRVAVGFCTADEVS
jgi:hypothetical protein